MKKRYSRMAACKDVLQKIRVVSTVIITFGFTWHLDSLKRTRGVH
jgi:hypothetical protein